MISCKTARGFLLEADLDAIDESDVGAHLDTCEACRVTLARLEAGEQGLSGLLDQLAARVAPEADPTAARMAAAGASRSSLLRWRVLAPLAVAALGGVALFGPRPHPGAPYTGGPEWTLPVANLESIQPVVSSSSHEKVVVLPTDNPNITVIWFMN